MPLFSWATLQSLAQSISINERYISPLLDARRMEVYSSVYNEKHENCREVLAEIITENSFENYLEKSKVYFLGDGGEKCKSIIEHPNAEFIDNKFPSANDMGMLSFDKHKKNEIEDVAYFEPYYLKDFIALKPKA